jgi:hypothetical protein
LERIKKFCMAVIFAWENIKISENFKIS